MRSSISDTEKRVGFGTTWRFDPNSKTKISLRSSRENLIEEEEIDDNMKERMKMTKLYQLKALNIKLKKFNNLFNKKSKDELLQAWKTVYDAEEEAHHLKLKSEMASSMMNIHGRIEALDNSMEIVREQIITGSDCVRPLLDAGKIISTQILVHENENYESNRQRLTTELIELDLALKQIPDITTIEKKVEIDPNIFRKKHENEKKLNLIQEKLLRSIEQKVSDLKIKGKLRSPSSKSPSFNRSGGYHYSTYNTSSPPTPSRGRGRGGDKGQDGLHVAFGITSPSRKQRQQQQQQEQREREHSKSPTTKLKSPVRSPKNKNKKKTTTTTTTTTTTK